MKRLCQLRSLLVMSYLTVVSISQVPFPLYLTCFMSTFCVVSMLHFRKVFEITFEAHLNISLNIYKCFSLNTVNVQGNHSRFVVLTMPNACVMACFFHVDSSPCFCVSLLFFFFLNNYVFNGEDQGQNNERYSELHFG